MLIERTKEKRPEGLLTKIGELLGSVADALKFFSDELQYKIVEKEVKE